MSTHLTSTLFFIISGISVATTGYCILIIVRNDQVYRFRTGLLNDMVKYTHDVSTFRQVMAVYESVSYDQMVTQFWRPLRSFYPVGYLDNLKGEPANHETFR